MGKTNAVLSNHKSLSVDSSKKHAQNKAISTTQTTVCAVTCSIKSKVDIEKSELEGTLTPLTQESLY